MAEAINVVVLVEEFSKIIRAQKETNESLVASCNKLQAETTSQAKELYVKSNEISDLKKLIDYINSIVKSEETDLARKIEQIGDSIADYLE